MSKFMLKVALMMGSLALVSGSARAGQKWYGPFDSVDEAHSAGDHELYQNGANTYGTDYYSVDPSGRGWGEGYYVSVQYPDAPTPDDGILGVPLPEVVGPAAPGPDDGNPDDDGEMGS